VDHSNTLNFDQDLLLKLAEFCPKRQYKAGEIVRQIGEHYHDTLIISKGKLSVRLATTAHPASLHTRRSGPVGEIGFLWGTPACATITALEHTQMLVLDDHALSNLAVLNPPLALRVVQSLKQTARERLSTTLALNSCEQFARGGEAISVLMCRKPEQLLEAQKLRYDVYCRELGRSSPFADVNSGTIADDLDENGKTFIAVQDGSTVGTLRVNYSCDGGLDELERLYGMRASVHHPRTTAVCTKFIIQPAARGGAAALILISALTKHLLRHNIHECYIDCIPPLLHYYRATENGRSVPLKLNLARHGAALADASSPLQKLRFFLRVKFYKYFPGQPLTLSPDANVDIQSSI